MFDKAKDLYKVQKEARKIKGELKNTHIEAESEGVTITINGEQKVMSVKISDDAIKKATENKKGLEESLEKAFNKGIEKSQQIGAEKMKDIMGGMNFPGMG